METENRARTAIVTGGSRGIGLGIARTYLSAGLNVMITGRERDALERAESSLLDLPGVVRTAVADVTNPADMHAVAEYTLDEFNGLDILCANAGIYPKAAIDSLTPTDLDTVFGTNTYGTFYATQACLPALKQSVSGRIVVISSITGAISGYPELTHYAASKAAQLGFVRSAAVEFASWGITVNAILPGTIREEEYAASLMRTDPLVRAIPVGRFGSPADIGHAALFLASVEAGFITGQSLVVDGGQMLPEIPAH